ncbi:hypothetical protein OHA72_22635 [Dactylosporangium sp. NBC_01737]|uniref:hypothetical protein n=1 Tax=Dactylosporangium sp. NBC_01737 TaxID=2975959 RepID=UPI002E13F8DB|nr:hypothetical protein OHA72_22635 [Dactylosporangium sp. NBC_01737]
MTDYLSFILNSGRQDGSRSVVAAAMEHLGSDPLIDPTDDGRWRFRDVHDVAVRLRNAFRQE